MRKWSIIPRRTEYAQRLTTMRTAFASTWARLYRQVFWLSDGRRTVEYISVLLHKPSNRIEQVTYELLASGHVKVQAAEKQLGLEPVALKHNFTPQMKLAWSKDYEIISAEMLKRANQRPAEETVSIS